MSVQVTILVCLAVLLLFIIIHRIMGSRHPVRNALLSMLVGVLSLAIVNMCSAFTGVDIPVSRLSVACAAFLGIPGVTTMLLLQILL